MRCAGCGRRANICKALQDDGAVLLGAGGVTMTRSRASVLAEIERIRNGSTDGVYFRTEQARAELKSPAPLEDARRF
jgi:hypothetical protein